MAKKWYDKQKAILVLQDGTVFEGYSFGAEGETQGEVVFNTSMMGYQEILTDPSYKGQIVTMTYPMIGNYGVNPVDIESAIPQVSGLIVKEYSSCFSNFRASTSLADYLKTHGVIAIEGIDTRALVRHIREKGAMPGLISTEDASLTHLKKKAKKLPTMDGQDLVKDVSCHQSYTWDTGTYAPEYALPNPNLRTDSIKRVIAYDFGMKQNILRNLVDIGCEVTVVPANTPAQEVLDKKPDGVFLSNGPGDPAAVDYAIQNVKKMVGKVPIFGICLGHQILGLALGAKTFKLKFGHRGANHPIMNLETKRVEVTSQNHGFAIDKNSMPKGGELTHVNLNDQTVAGFRDKARKILAVQYHPEASPGPHDSLYLFQQFRQMMDAED